MTTEDTTEVVEESTETTTKDRDINALLALDSYDNLTDGEVRTLIDYKCKIAISDEETNIVRNANMQRVEAASEAAAACCASTVDVLNSIIASTTNYEGVSPTAVTNLLTSLEEV